MSKYIKLDHLTYKGTRIDVGHPVRILPSEPGKRDGFDSLVRAIYGDPTTRRIAWIEVIDPYNGGMRALRTNRIQPYLRSVESKRATITKRLDQLRITRRSTRGAAQSRSQARKGALAGSDPFGDSGDA